MPRRGKALATPPADQAAASWLLALYDHEPALLQYILEEVRDTLALFRLTRVCARLHGLVQPQIHTLMPMLQYPAAEVLVERPQLHTYREAVWAKLFTMRPSDIADDIEIQASIDPNLNSKKWRKRLVRALSRGQSVNALHICADGWDEGATALGSAVHIGYAPVVRFLLLHGADPNQFDGRGRRPLHRCLEGRPTIGGNRDPRTPAAEIMQMLLRAGADPTLKSTKTTKHSTWPAWLSNALGSAPQFTPIEELHDELRHQEEQLRKYTTGSIIVPAHMHRCLQQHIASLRECLPVLQATPPPHRMHPRATLWELPTE